MVWLSPAFPVGAFAYSHGLEWAVEAGDVRDAPTLVAWLRDLLRHGAAQSDLALLCAAWRAQDGPELRRINALALALSPSRERYLEASAQGSAFVAAARAAWPCPGLAHFPTGEATAYPVAVGALAAGHEAPLSATCEAFALAVVAALVSAAVRLGAIGQSAAQMAQAQLLPDMREAAARAPNVSLDALGGCALRSDIAAMRHETQYSRLFRS